MNFRILKAENGYPSVTLKEFSSPSPEEAKSILKEEQSKPINMFSILWLEQEGLDFGELR